MTPLPPIMDDEWVTAPNPWGPGTLRVSAPKHVVARMRRDRQVQQSLVLPAPCLGTDDEESREDAGIAGRVNAWGSSTDVFWDAVAHALGCNVLELKRSELRALQVLDLSGWAITQLDPVQYFLGLRYLDLSYTKVSDLAPLGTLVQLERLELKGTLLRTVSAFDPLMQLPNLRYVGIEGTLFDDDMWAQLSQSMSSVDFFRYRYQT